MKQKTRFEGLLSDKKITMLEKINSKHCYFDLFAIFLL